MAKTRSHASSSSSSSAKRPACSSSATARKSRRRRTVAMPEKKRKLRRQKALQKQIAIAKALQPVVTTKTGKRNTKSSQNYVSKQPALLSTPSDKLNPNPKAACRKSTRKSSNNDSPVCNRSHKASEKTAVVSMEKERNPNSAEECRKSTKTRETSNQDAVFQATCKKVRTSEAADACSGECDRDQVIEVNHGNGWTSEQDLALQSAYFQVRPSSNFWFEVSKKFQRGQTDMDRNMQHGREHHLKSVTCSCKYLRHACMWSQAKGIASHGV